MPNPREVFENPQNFWNFITLASDDDYEGQCFDRKEAGTLDNNSQVDKKQLKGVKNHIIKCISAFANANREGGLLILGVSKAGEIKGTSHLSEAQINSITAFGDLLRYQSATARFLDCKNCTDSPDQILLIFTPYTENGICETLEKNPSAWFRSGPQNLPVNDDMREQLKRDKKIVDYDRAYCCPFDPLDIDEDVLAEFKKEFLEDAKYELTNEQILYEAGMIQREASGHMYNNAGFLFIARNPQRVLPWAYIRLMRFEVNIDEEDSRGLPTFDKKFAGPIAQQIRKIRTFFRDSGFFKTFQKRNPEGGFIEDPEFPYIAIDEAIVNAVAHRDYGVQWPIECIHYRNAFTVRNPGRILQRDQDLPFHFSLDNTSLSSMPRNSKLIEWLRIMRDEKGAAFVRAISEGTKRMQQEMEDAGLRSPLYDINHLSTKLTLFNNVAEREALQKVISKGLDITEITNFFPVDFLKDDRTKVSLEVLRHRRKEFMVYLKDALKASGWYIDRFRFGRIIAHRRGVSLNLPHEVSRFVGFYPAYSFQLRDYWGKYYLVIDYTLTVRNIENVRSLLSKLSSRDLIEKRAIARYKGWQRGKILSADVEFTKLFLFKYESEIQVPSNEVIPEIPIGLLRRILHESSISFDLSKEIKRYSLASEPGASRTRHEKTIATAERLSEDLFPLILGDLRVHLKNTPESLQRESKVGGLQVRTLSEPLVEFSHHKETPNIREGITSFGAYQDARETIELVPVCTNNLRDKMASLINRLKVGKYKYGGSERTFSTKLIYSSIITVPSPEEVLDECQRLLGEHPDWAGNTQLDRLFLIHTPEADYALDDENSPYYKVKRFLLEQGIPCQMVNTPTILNPEWKDLNLTLNIIAKCGITPWVLPNRIPDADFFIGLSYTQSRIRGTRRLLGYATVFNEFGRWEFYTGNTEAFSYEDRTKYFKILTKQTMKRLTLSDSPSIYFHYSARFSKEDRKAILNAARSVRPNGSYSFVWINFHHNIRLYDIRTEADGSLSRGSYVITSPNQILLSTTGYNPFRKFIGTPKPLEINIRTEKPEGIIEKQPDLKSLAVQVLSLTKLNWASTDSVAGEPITTKYAGEIAYLTDAFLRQSESFRLHPALETTPWFI